MLMETTSNSLAHGPLRRRSASAPSRRAPGCRASGTCGTRRRRASAACRRSSRPSFTVLPSVSRNVASRGSAPPRCSTMSTPWSSGGGVLGIALAPGRSTAARARRSARSAHDGRRPCTRRARRRRARSGAGGGHGCASAAAGAGVRRRGGGRAPASPATTLGGAGGGGAAGDRSSPGEPRAGILDQPASGAMSCATPTARCPGSRPCGPCVASMLHGRARSASHPTSGAASRSARRLMSASGSSEPHLRYSSARRHVGRSTAEEPARDVNRGAMTIARSPTCAMSTDLVGCRRCPMAIGPRPPKRSRTPGPATAADRPRRRASTPPCREGRRPCRRRRRRRGTPGRRRLGASGPKLGMTIQ